MTIATTLNDTQLVLLATASQNNTGSLYPLPASLGESSPRIAKAIDGLLKRGLVGEVPTNISAQVWRTGEDARFGLIITDAGRVAIGVEPRELIGVSGDGDTLQAPPSATSTATEEPLNRPSAIRAGTKQALVVYMLSADGGASLEALVAATGWLPHTTRAAITGLRKRGHVVLTDRRDGACHYRIAAV